MGEQLLPTLIQDKADTKEIHQSQYTKSNENIFEGKNIKWKKLCLTVNNETII